MRSATQGMRFGLSGVVNAKTGIRIVGTMRCDEQLYAIIIETDSADRLPPFRNLGHVENYEQAMALVRKSLDDRTS